jgi:lycopene cyclase domain-containing protein
LHRPHVRWFDGSSSQRARWLVSGGFLAASLIGALMLETTSTLYMGLIMAWAAPVLALQWIVGGHHLWKAKKLVLAAFVPPSIYLCIADAIAIWNGVWVISEETSTGLMVGVLPIEEILFFFVTNLLVVQGALLAAHQLRHSKLADLRLEV